MAPIEPSPTLYDGDPPVLRRPGRPGAIGPMMDMALANPGRWVRSGRKLGVSTASRVRNAHPEFDWQYAMGDDRRCWLYARFDPSRNPR